MTKAGGEKQVWRQEGFSEFIKGTFGNAGHNLYVSKGGVLQRIHHFDFNNDGYNDLLFCNSHDDVECPPSYAYSNPLGDVSRTDLPSYGARCAEVADLCGDGYDDLILGMWCDGISSYQNAIIYHGGPEGWSERRTELLPAPYCRSVAVGDFNGDGKPDIAFISYSKVRIYYQSECGFECQRYKDFQPWELEVTEHVMIGAHKMEKAPADRPSHVAGADVDGDGYADLILRCRNGETRVYWGGEDGIDKERFSVIPIEVDEKDPIETEPPRWAKKLCPKSETWAWFYEWAIYVEVGDQPNGQMPMPRPQVIMLDGNPHVSVPRLDGVHLVPVSQDRSFAQPLFLPCERPMAVAVGDVNGDGHEDIVIAAQEQTEDDYQDISWIYWGGEKGFDPQERTPLQTFRACDVSVGDLDGNGCDDIVLAQSFHMTSWTHDALIYRGSKDKVFEEPTKLTGHNSMRVLIGQPSGDGKLVVAMPNRMEGDLRGRSLPAYVYYGGPDGFSPEGLTEIPNWGAIDAVCCDVNDDGHADLVLANGMESPWEKSEIYLLLNGPDGFSKEPSLCLPAPANAICCADLNRDGYLDIVTGMFADPELRIFYGNAHGFEKEPTCIRMELDGVVYSDPRWMCLADFNNDGWLDLFVSQIYEDRSLIFWGGPEGFSMDRVQMLSVLKSGGGIAADLTGNGYPDLVVGGSRPSKTGPHDSFAYIYWNGPDGLRENNHTVLPCNAACSISIADFNNDGLLDIFISNYWGSSERDIPSYIYWNRKGRGFSIFDRTELPTNSASGSVVADFNEDGYVDIAVAYHKVHGSHVGHSAVWWNGPDGFCEKNVTTLPTRGPHGMIWVDPGNVMDRGDEEYYTSCAHKLPDGAKVTCIEWEAELQVKTWIKAQLRFAKTEEELADAAWQGPDGEGSWFEDKQSIDNMKQDGPWVQYRLALGAKNSGNSPRISSVSIHHK